ncbi:ATP-binding protein [Aeromonas veronii]
MKFVERKQNADRVCEGISKIGYKFNAAIEDIVDNSVAAGAKNISICFELEDGATLSEKNKITMIRIIDDGCGMNSQKVETALDLGSEVSYAENSLSKFGFGLKSAGFSLARCVSVYSKSVEGVTPRYYLDRDVIKEKNTYGVCIVPLSEREHVIVTDSGTVIDLDKIKTPHDSTNKILKELRERLGVLYHDFMVNKYLSISLHYKGNVEKIEPKDILFWDATLPAFDPDHYDGKLPCRVIEREIEVLDLPNVTIKAVAFPQNAMSKYAQFSEQERAQIKNFDITRKNSGFFIFRNNRLIRWGDLLGIVTRDDIGFRARIDIGTVHDDTLQVDVSKQNLELSEHFLDSLQNVCRIPLSQAREIFKKCADILNVNGGEEGQKTSETLETIPEEDPDLDVEQIDKSEQRKRRNKNQEKSSKEDNDAQDNVDTKPNEPIFKKIRYSDSIGKSVIFTSEMDPEFGIYIRINKCHQFYHLVLKSLPEASPTRVAIEGLLYSMAVGEKKTEENLQSIQYEDIISVFDKFHRVSSYTLENWASRNQDLF